MVQDNFVFVVFAKKNFTLKAALKADKFHSCNNFNQTRGILTLKIQDGGAKYVFGKLDFTISPPLPSLGVPDLHVVPQEDV